MEKLIKHANNLWETLEKGENKGGDALGIGSGKLKFNPGFGQKEFRHYVEEKADHLCDTGYVAGEPDDFNWHYDPDYNLSKLTPLKGGKAGWVAWYDGEMVEWKHDHGDAKKGHFEKWSKNPKKKPLVVIEGTDGKDHIVDGHHRCAMAHIQDMENVPVIYGRRKTEMKKIDEDLLTEALEKTDELSDEWFGEEELTKEDLVSLEELAKTCPRCGGASANSSNASGRCSACLKKLSSAKKKPGSWQRAQTKADDALRRQKGKNGTAHKKSSGLGSRKSIVKQTQSAEKKTGQKLSPDRKNNGKGYAASNTRMVPEKLNRGRHHVDGKKLRAWQKRLKKTDLTDDQFYTMVLAKAQE